MKTITLTPMCGKDVITNFGNTLMVTNVSNYRVGNKLIWIEYNDGESIIAVKRNDYNQMRIDERYDVVLHGDDFERINCEPYSNT